VTIRNRSRFVARAALVLALMIAVGARPTPAAMSLGGWMASSPDDITGFTTLSGDNSYWDDMQTQGTNIRYGTVGSSPNRVFVVDFVMDTETATDTPTATATETATETPSATSTVTPTITETATVTPTETPTNSPTSTPTPLGSCPPTPPLVKCRTAVATRSLLSMAQKTGDATRNKLAWVWKGGLVHPADLGNPTTTTDYRLCFYDGADTLFLNLLVPAGGDCGTAPCWKTLKTGFAYKKKEGTTEGVAGFSIKVGADGIASLKLKAKGDRLDLPTLPLAQAPQPVRVMMINNQNGLCLSASYSDPPARTVESTEKWKDKSD